MVAHSTCMYVFSKPNICPAHYLSCYTQAFLVLSTQQCESHLTSPNSGLKLYSSPTPSTLLDSILMQHLPCCLALGSSGVSADWWEGIISLLTENVRYYV